MRLNCLLLLVVASVSSCTNFFSSTVLTEASFTEGIEGPAVDSSGDLYLVNFKKEGTVGRIKKGTRRAELFIELPGESIGNGIRFINDSVFVLADYVQHQLLLVNKNNKRISVLVKNNTMNQPNDVAVSKVGNIYASDPNWSENTGQLWLIKTDGTCILLDENMGTTNGIEVSTDEKYLYVNESVQRKIWRFELLPSGEVQNKKLFYSFDSHGMDGMRCDSEGNLYIARYEKGTIAVLSPEGKLLHEIKLHGSKPTNLAFGGEDGKSVFVTMQGEKWVEQFTAKYPGRSFLLAHGNE